MSILSPALAGSTFTRMSSRRRSSYMGAAVPAGWPSMAEAKPCHKHVMMAGRIYRTVSDRCWDVGKRVADMAEMGLGRQAISPMPELLSYWMEPAAANDLLRYINDQIAEMVSHSGGRLTGLGAVPLQDIDLAIAELHRLKHGLGFAGIEIGSNINGKPVGAPEFDGFFAEVEKLDMAVFVHALRPAGMDRLVGPAQLQQVLAYPTDIGLAAASVITSNLLLRRPACASPSAMAAVRWRRCCRGCRKAGRCFPCCRRAFRRRPSHRRAGCITTRWSMTIRRCCI